MLPARVPSRRRALVPSTTTSSSPSVYSPAGMPPARIQSVIRTNLSLLLQSITNWNIAGWTWMVSQIISV